MNRIVDCEALLKERAAKLYVDDSMKLLEVKLNNTFGKKATSSINTE
jgi:hypothetical protein